MGPERKVLPGFSLLSIFFLLPNSKKYCFLLYFPLYVFHSPYFHPNKIQYQSLKFYTPKVDLFI